MVVDSEAFPRGKVTPAVAKVSTGGGVVNRTVKNKLENLFATTEVKKRTKLKRQNKLTSDEVRLISGDGKRGRISGSGPMSFQVVPLSYDQLIVDMLSLGVVHEIYNDSMLIVLPGRATGIVNVTNVSTVYTNLLKKNQKALTKGENLESFHTLRDMFNVGQVVVVKVISTGKKDDGKTDIRLTMDPQEIHTNYNSTMIETNLTLVGAIKSKEDKGYQVDLGVGNVIAFLPFGEAHDKNDCLGVGQLIYCKVTQVKSDKGSRRSVQVSMNLGKLKNQVRNEEGVINYSALLPGMALNTIVEEAHETGLKLSCYSLDGLVHTDHMLDPWTTSSSVEPAAEMHARVLYIHPNLTTPYLTLQMDLVPLKKSKTVSEDVTKIGSLQTVRVVSATGRGVIVRFVESNEKGFISLHHLGDGPFTSKEDIEKKFKSKSDLQCRVLKYAHFERMYICSLNKNFMESSTVNIQQAIPGEKLKCKISGFNSGGIEVLFGHNLPGFVPLSFCGRRMNWFKKQEDYLGKTVSGRIMQVELDKKRVVITLIPDLIKSQGAVISELASAKAGLCGHCVVIVVSKGGAVVKTIGGVKGFIPVGRFKIKTSTTVDDDGEKDVLDCREHVKIGDVIQYKVQKIEKDKGQLILKPFEDKDDEDEGESIPPPQKKKRKRASESSEGSELRNCNKKDKKKRRRNKKKKSMNDESSDEEEDVDVKPDDMEHVENETEDSGVEDVPQEDTDDDDKVEETKNLDEIKTEEEDVDFITNGMNDFVGDMNDFWSEDGLVKKEEEEEEMEVDSVNDTKKSSKQLSESVKQKTTTGDVSTSSASNMEVVMNYENHGVTSKTRGAGEWAYWTGLMSHYLAEGLVDKARNVAREALDYGPIAQKSEKALKIWKALFLLELKFGANEDAAKNILREALQRTDSKYDCYKMAALTYEREGRFEDAQNVYRNHITRECGDNVDGWINFARLHFEKNRLEEARDIFHTASKQIAVRNLNEANLTSRFAILEIYHGDVGKGTMLLDTLLQAHPQRVDIWVVYVQALIKKKEFDKTRAVFSRAFEMEWKPQKVKSLLAQYKTFEEKYGTEETKSRFAAAAVKVLDAGGINVLS